MINPGFGRPQRGLAPLELLDGTDALGHNLLRGYFDRVTFGIVGLLLLAQRREALDLFLLQWGLRLENDLFVHGRLHLLLLVTVIRVVLLLAGVALLRARGP